MAKIKFRTADGRVVSFTSKGTGRRNPSDSPRYRAMSRVASAVDALDRTRAAKKRKSESKAKVVCKVVRKAKVRRVSASTKGWTKRLDCRGRVYYLRKRSDGGHDMKWGASGKIIRLAPPFKRGGGRRSRPGKLKAKGACGVPVHKRKGDTFVRRGVLFRVATRKTSKGGFKRVAVRVKRSRR